MSQQVDGEEHEEAEEEHDRGVQALGEEGGFEGADENRGRQDEQNVEHVGTDDVSQHDAVVVPVGRHEAGGEFGHAGAESHDRESDDLLADAEVQRQILRRGHQEPGRADGEQDESHEGAKDGLGCADALGIGWFGVAGSDQDEQEVRHQREQHHALEPAQAAEGGEGQDEQGSGEHEGELAADQADRLAFGAFAVVVQRHHERRDAEDQTDVGDVRTDYVAVDQPGGVPQRGRYRHAEFRRRGTEGDDGEPDHRRTDAENRGQAGHGAHEDLAAGPEHGDAEHNQQQGDQHGLG